MKKDGMNLPSTYNPIGNKFAILLVTLLLCVTSNAQATSKTTQEKTTVQTSRAPTSAEKNTPPQKNTETNKVYPINVSADQLISQTKGGQSEYKGNVFLERNKLTIQGQTLKLIHPGDKLQQAIMSGNLAKFKDYLPKKQQWVNGEAKQIIFNQDQDTVTLLDNAFMIMDNGNQIHADKIIIHNKDETFEANGSKQSGRVKMTIQPE
jgi:lipopolysaccharide transport protein LptA